MSKKLTLALATLPLLAALAGCAEDNGDAAKQALERTLNVGQTVEYGKISNYPGGGVCGEYNLIGRFNVREGMANFVYRDGAIDRAPSDDDLAIFCSDDPAAAFLARFGIDPLDASNTTLAKVREDLQALDQALQQYFADNRIYPLTNQGLEALLVASEIHPTPTSFKEGGYLDIIPVDPWGRPYQYRSEETLRMEPIVYSLATLGRDGKAGGSGADADIDNGHLKYLNHLATL